MITTLDVLYIVLSVCTLVLTIVFALLGLESFKIVRDLRRISQNVEDITQLVHRIARIVFPGVERVANDARNVEERVHGFIQNWFTNRGKKSEPRPQGRRRNQEKL